MKARCGILVLINIFFLGMLVGCTQESVRVKGIVYDIEYIPIRRGNKRVVAYQFQYKDSTYVGHETYTKVSKWHYAQWDSVWVSFPKNKPEKSKLDTIFFRPQEQVIIDSEKRDDEIFVYRSLTNKPLFIEAKNANENEIKLEEYINKKKRTLGLEGSGEFYCRFIIEKNGDLSELHVMEGINEEVDSFIINILSSSNLFTPGKMDDKPIRVFMRLGITIE